MKNHLTAIISILIVIAFFAGYFAANLSSPPVNQVNEKQVVNIGDTVKVDYWGTLDNGTMFDTSEGRQPLEFTAGAGQVIKGFDQAVIGMKPGEEKTIKVPPQDAYGEYDEKAIIEVPIDKIKSTGIEPKKGDKLFMGSQLVTVLNVTNESVTIDTNHPLAGKTLNFKIKLIEIK